MQDRREKILHEFPEDEDEDSDLPDFSCLLNMGLWKRTEEEEDETAELDDPERRYGSDLWKGCSAVSPRVSAPVLEKVSSEQFKNDEAPAEPSLPAAASATKATHGKLAATKRKTMDRDKSDPDYVFPAKKTKTHEAGSSTGDIPSDEPPVTKTRTTRPRRAKEAVLYLLDFSSDEDMFS